MFMRRRGSNQHELVKETSEIAGQVARAKGEIATMLVSALALLFSGVSLYQSVIKQAQIHIFTPDSVFYTIDPNGTYEVFAIPVTVSNSGARDGIISSLKLEARNVETGISRTLEASYFADPGYFTTWKIGGGDIARRPKSPFAPLSVTGRGSVTATVLFYPREYKEEKEKVVPVEGDPPGKGRYELVLTAKAKPTETLGFLDRLWSSDIAPQTLKLHLPEQARLFYGRLLAGNTVRMLPEE